jgi:RNA polymerase sigma-70 factor (ECF subfamily)
VADFEEIYKEYYPQIYYYLLKLSSDKDCAEELTQETFFRALKSIDSFRGDCEISTWLCQIAKNCFYTYARREKITVNSDLLLNEEITGKSVEEVVSDKEAYIKIQEILHKIGDPYKEVFWMRAFAELSFAQIASIHGKTEGWARVTYHRAKMMVKEGLE